MVQGIRWNVLFCTSVVCIGLFIGGCSKKNDSVTGASAGDLSTPGASISDAVRLASLDTLSSFFSNLPGVDAYADQLAALNFLRSRPEFEDVGVAPDGNNVWARFTDGRLVMYVDTRTPSTEVIDPPIVDTAALGKAYNLMPSNTTARVLNSLGTAYAGANASTASIRSWCKQAGYTLSTPDDPTVTNLKLMHNDGILYWVTHGGYGKTKDGSVSSSVSLWTSEPVSKAGDTLYKADLDAHLINYMFGKTNAKRNGVRDSSMHYSVTGAFMAKYVTPDPFSLVFFDAAYSSLISFGASGFYGGLYLGWSGPVNDASGSKATRYFFDKVLGVNKQTPLLPEPMRPIMIADVLGSMMKNGLNAAGPSTTLQTPFETPLVNFRQLVPSILMINQASYTETYVDGDFSSAQNGAQVLLNEAPIKITKWDPSGITVANPQSGGTIVVSAGKVRSNPVNLTEWSGTIEWVKKGDGTLQQHVHIDAHFWADIHWLYGGIGMKPEYGAVGRMVKWMPITTCTFDCSGETRDSKNVIQESWSGSGSLPLLEFGDMNTGFSSYVMIDADGTNSQCILLVNGKFTKHFNGGTDQLTSLDLSSTPLAWTHTLTDFSINGGTASVGGGTLTWSKFTAKYPPNRKAPH